MTLGSTVGCATAHDAAGIAELDVRLVAPQRLDELVRTSISAGTCLVERDGSAVVGYLIWNRGFFGRPFVWLLAVTATRRRRGLGRALLVSAERDAAPYGELFVSTERGNSPMRTLLTALGYQASGSIDNLNAPGNPEDVYYKRFVL